MKKKLSILFLILILCLGFFVINRKSLTKTSVSNSEITASFYPYYFFASQIVGDKIVVENITPSGIEPHDYEPTTGDIIKMKKSKLVIVNGLVEPWLDKINSNKNILVVIEGLTSTDDPHIWLSLQLAKKQVEVILNKITSIDPMNKDFYTANADQLIGKIDKLDRQYNNVLKSCKKKDIVTSHDAFGYLAGDYGLHQVSVAGLSPEEEPSLKQMTEISNFVKQNNIKYVFFESLVNPKLSETIAIETGTKTLVLNPIEGLTQEEIDQNKNYLTIMEDNLHNLSIALECN